MKLSILLVSPLLTLGIVASLCACEPLPGGGFSAIKDTLSDLLHPREPDELDGFNELASMLHDAARLDRDGFWRLRSVEISLPTLPSRPDMGMFERIWRLQRIRQELSDRGKVGMKLQHFEDVYMRHINQADKKTLKRLQTIAGKANSKLKELEEEWKLVTAFGSRASDSPPTVQFPEVYHVFRSARSFVSERLRESRLWVGHIYSARLPDFAAEIPLQANKVRPVTD